MSRKMRKFLKYTFLLSIPALLIGLAYVYQHKLPSMREVQRTARDFEPVKQLEKSYEESVEKRLEGVDPKRLKGSQEPTHRRRKTRSGEWKGPAAQDPESTWKTSKQSEWRGPGAR